MAALDLRLAQKGGSAVVIEGQLLDWDTTNELLLSLNGDQHELKITARRPTEGRELTVQLEYWRNGDALIEGQTFTVQGGKPKQLEADGKRPALKFTLTPKEVELPPKKLADVGDSRDPLSGLD